MKPAHVTIALFITIFISLVAAVGVYALTIDPHGNIVVGNEGQVLSSSDDKDDDDRSGSSSSGSSGSSSGSGSSGSSGESKTETTTTGGAVVRTEQKGDETRTETRLPSGVRIKTRQEPDKTRVDIYEGGTKLRLERRDDRTIVKLENAQGEEAEIGPAQEDEVFKIDERADKRQVRVRAAGEKFVITEASISATTRFPLSVSLETNELTVTTPAGSRVVAVLPDQAVRNMLAANIIDQVGGLSFTEDVQKVATEAGTTLGQIVELTTTRTGVLAYEIPGTKNEKLLGFIPVTINKIAVVSAETSELLGVKEPILTQLLDLISF